MPHRFGLTAAAFALVVPALEFDVACSSSSGGGSSSGSTSSGASSGSAGTTSSGASSSTTSSGGGSTGTDASSSATGINWPDGGSFPIFAPAVQLDVADLTYLGDDAGSEGGDSEDLKILFTTLEGRVNRTQPRIYLKDSAIDDQEGTDFWLNQFGVPLNPVADPMTLLTKYASEVAASSSTTRTSSTRSTWRRRSRGSKAASSRRRASPLS